MFNNSTSRGNFTFSKVDIGVFAIATIVFVYLIIKASIIPLFYDELTTLNFYVKTGLITPFNPYAKANNHILNSALTYCSYNLFGDSPLSLRLPNILAYVLYATYIFRLGKFFKSNYTRIGFSLALLLPLGIIDFFALSRGYGLSIAFLVVSSYYTFKAFHSLKGTYVFLSFITAFLSTLANLSMLLFALTTVALLCFNIFRKRVSIGLAKSVQLILLILSISIAFFFLIVDIVHFYQENNLLWWGLKGSFWDVTIQSQIVFLFNSKSIFYHSYVAILLVVMLAALLYKTKDLLKFDEKLIFPILFIANVVGIIILHIFLDVNLPYQRTGLHLSILFLLGFFFGIDYSRIRLPYFTPLINALTVVIPMSAIFNFSLYTVRYWENDSIPPEYIETISNESKSGVTTIRVDDMGFRSWNYQIFKENIKLPVVTYKPESHQYFDYVISVPQKMEYMQDSYRIVSRIDRFSPALYERIGNIEKDKINSYKLDSIITSSSEYYSLAEFKLSELASENILFRATMEIDFPEFPSKQYLYATASPSDSKYSLSSVSICLDDIVFEKQSNTRHVIFSGFLQNLGEHETLDIVLFIHNTQKKNLSVQKVNVDLYSVRKR